MAVFKLTEILANSIVISSKPPKAGDKNQKSFSRVLIMKYNEVRLVVGYQKTKDEYVQYAITARTGEK